MTQIRCRGGCGTFFDKNSLDCPTCGTVKRSVNIALVNQRWASNLNAQAAHAVKNG